MASEQEQEPHPKSARSPEQGDKGREVASFVTERGSVYTYDEEGKTTRFKKVTGETDPRKDITIFAVLTDSDIFSYLRAIEDNDPGGNTKVYVVERQLDDGGRIILDLDQVADPESLYLALVQEGKIIKTNPASLDPQIGTNVYESRHYEQDGQMMSDRHLGNQVVDIQYAE